MQKYLVAKYDFLKDVLPPDHEILSAPLETVKDPPPVQMFVPGFSVRELPLDLTNINNIKYRADGTLVALAYDGKIWLLRDTNGDGLEDKAELFWDNASGLRSPIGMDLTPPGYERGNGVFVVGKTRCMLIVDTNGDDKADQEIQVAGGWKESLHNVDGLGVAYDRKDGSVYFGRGTYNFADPLLRDKDGKPQYSLTDESGAIIRVSPDFKTHEIICTGIRFPVALRFNAHGDLFCTDQEGATWVPNGNPFDELLHIQRGRHYGFPARHPELRAQRHRRTQHVRLLAAAPKHVRHELQRARARRWSDFRSGRLGRRRARHRLFARQTLSHEARPIARRLRRADQSARMPEYADGRRLHQSRWRARLSPATAARPIGAAAPPAKASCSRSATPIQATRSPSLCGRPGRARVHVEFDRPVPPKLLHDVLTKTKLTAGRYVRAGDRFESLWPGYAAVQTAKALAAVRCPGAFGPIDAGRPHARSGDRSNFAGRSLRLTLPDDNPIEVRSERRSCRNTRRSISISI